MPAAINERRPFDSLPYGRFFEDDAEPSIVLSQRVLSDLGMRLEGRYTLPVTSEIRDFDHFGPRVGFFYRF